MFFALFCFLSLPAHLDSKTNLLCFIVHTLQYPVPRGLPAVAVKEYSKSDRKTLACSNTFLSMRYGALAMSLNRIKFYRDQRIQSKVDISISIPGNILEGVSP